LSETRHSFGSPPLLHSITGDKGPGQSRQHGATSAQSASRASRAREAREAEAHEQRGARLGHDRQVHDLVDERQVRTTRTDGRLSRLGNHAEVDRHVVRRRSSRRREDDPQVRARRSHRVAVDAIIEGSVTIRRAGLNTGEERVPNLLVELREEWVVISARAGRCRILDSAQQRSPGIDDRERRRRDDGRGVAQTVVLQTIGVGMNTPMARLRQSREQRP
jgi:hypothetical protein